MATCLRYNQIQVVFSIIPVYLVDPMLCRKLLLLKRIRPDYEQDFLRNDHVACKREPASTSYSSMRGRRLQ